MTIGAGVGDGRTGEDLLRIKAAFSTKARLGAVEAARLGMIGRAEREGPA